MSWSLTLSGHVADEEKMEAVAGIIRAAAYSLDALADRDAGDTFGGSLSGPNVSISFPESAAEAAPDGEYDDTPDTDVAGT